MFLREKVFERHSGDMGGALGRETKRWESWGAVKTPRGLYTKIFSLEEQGSSQEALSENRRVSQLIDMLANGPKTRKCRTS